MVIAKPDKTDMFIDTIYSLNPLPPKKKFKKNSNRFVHAICEYEFQQILRLLPDMETKQIIQASKID